MENLANNKHHEHHFKTGEVSDHYDIELRRVLLLQLVLFENDVLAVEHDPCKKDRDNNSIPSHCAVVYPLFKLWQHDQGNQKMTGQHRRDYDYALDREHVRPDFISAICQRVIYTNGSGIEDLATKVDSCKDPEVDLDPKASARSIFADHHGPDTQQEALENHEADIHHQDWKILQYFKSANSKLR